MCTVSSDSLTNFYKPSYWHTLAGSIRNQKRLQTIPMAASATIMTSLTLKPSTGFKPAPSGLPSLARPASTLRIQASGVKKIKTDKPYGIGGGMNLRDGVDSSGRKPTGKGVYQFTDKYGANVDGYSPIYNPEEWSPTGDVYVGGTAGLAIWAITLAGLLAGGALLVYNTSALAQ